MLDKSILTKGTLSTEALAFQDKVFFNEITEFLESVRNYVKDLGSRSNHEIQNAFRKIEAETGFYKKVFDRTGIKLDISLSNIPAGHLSVSHSTFNSQSSLLNLKNRYQIKGQKVPKFEELQAIHKSLTGEVDLEKGKLSGMFSEMPITMFMSYKAFSPGCSIPANEIMAGFLHELGHHFFFCLYLTNEAFKNFAIKAYMDGDDSERDAITQTIILPAAAKNKQEARKIVASKPKAEILLVRGLDNYCKIESDALLYSQSGNEALADKFASRFGAGHELMKFLNRTNERAMVDSLHPYRVTIIRVLKVVGALIGLMYGSLLMLNGLAFFSVGNVFGLITATAAGFAIRSILSQAISRLSIGHASFANESDFTYSSASNRLKRIRNEQVQFIRSLTDKDNMYKEQLEVLAEMDDIIKNYSENHSLLSGFLLFFNPTQKKILNAAKQEQFLEKMISNDLHVASAMLKTI